MPSTATATRPPHVPHHEMVRAIGRGSYGEIWLARSLTGAWRAVKIVDRRRFEDERSFEREFDGMARFEPVSREHEGFVDILHVGRSDDGAFFYYVMELADDVVPRAPFDPAAYQPKTLKSELARVGRMPADEAISLGLSLTTALSELHGHGLVHRDIKPANIIFVGGAPKVADIGLVSAMGQNSFVGTEGYVPPEGPGNEQSDIFSLGKVLYEIAMGKDRLQFPEMNTRLGDLPDRDMLLRLNEVLLRACAHSQTERYATSAEMHEDLLRARDGRPLTHRPHRRRWMVAALLLVFAAGAWAFFSPPGPPPGKGGVLIEVDPPVLMRLFDGQILPEDGRLDDVPEGPHTLKILNPDYEPLETTIHVVANTVARPEKFILQRRKGSVAIESAPPKVRFDLRQNGALIRSGEAPETLEGLPVGSYEIAMTHNGVSKAVEVVVRHDGTPPIKLAFGSQAFSITSTPPGAEIMCDGKSLGTAPLKVNLPEGNHILTASYKGSQTAPREVTAAPGEPEQGHAFAFGCRVKIATRPKGATVFRNGERLGATPLLVENLDPGDVTFVLKLDRYKDATVSAVAKPEKQEFVEVDFEQRPGPREGEPFVNGLGMRFVPAGELFAGVWPVRVADFEAFCTAALRSVPATDFAQTPDHPVVNVNWDDARLFCEWLTVSERTAGRLDAGQVYRLPTDAEWSTLAGIPDEGGATPEQRDGKVRDFPWGRAWPPPPGWGNFADLTMSTKKDQIITGYTDGWRQTSPVGAFKPNAAGLFDMSGNVWQWVADKYQGEENRKSYGVLRGGSWGTSQQNELRLGYRDVVGREERDPLFGFRCVIARGRE